MKYISYEVYFVNTRVCLLFYALPYLTQDIRTPAELSFSQPLPSCKPGEGEIFYLIPVKWCPDPVFIRCKATHHIGALFLFNGAEARTSALFFPWTEIVTPPVTQTRTNWPPSRFPKGTSDPKV